MCLSDWRTKTKRERCPFLNRRPFCHHRTGSQSIWSPCNLVYYLLQRSLACFESCSSPTAHREAAERVRTDTSASCMCVKLYCPCTYTSVLDDYFLYTHTLTESTKKTLHNLVEKMDVKAVLWKSKAPMSVKIPCAKWLLVTVWMPRGTRELSIATWTAETWSLGRIKPVRMTVFGSAFTQSGNEKFLENTMFFFFCSIKYGSEQMLSSLKCPVSRWW